MSTAVTTTQQPDTLATLLRQPAYANRFKEVLGDRAGQFVSSVLSVGATMRDVDPTSIISSAMIAASLDLPVNKNLGFAWIVPYAQGGRKLAQFQMGYKGFVQLALRTGQYARMNVRSVNAEAFGGFDDVGEPIILWDKIDESKEAVGYVFAWKLTSGFTKVCYWSKEKVEAHAKQYSQAYRSGGQTPWKSHFDAMAKKTVVKNELSHWGVLSVEFQTALDADQGVEADGEVEYLDNKEKAKPAPKLKPPLESKPIDVEGEEVQEAAQGLAPAPAATPAPPAPPKEAALSGQQPPHPTAQSAATQAPLLAAEQVSSPAGASKTPQTAIGAFLEAKGVTFDDFKGWLLNAGHYREADSMATIEDLPTEICIKLGKNTAALERCATIYGKPKE